MKILASILLLLLLLLVSCELTLANILNANEFVDTSVLRQAVTVENIQLHLQAFQAIADQHDGNRAVGTSGYTESLHYVLQQLVLAGYTPTVQEFTISDSSTITTQNVIAETYQGNDQHVIMVGAHLDSVDSGPGINDNGSGAAAILEIAIQLQRQPQPLQHGIRFAWWGAEEVGLLGSQYYVDSMNTDDELSNIMAYLNFDMIASPNYVRFIEDGDGSVSESIRHPPGSDVIEYVFMDYFENQNLPYKSIPMAVGAPYTDYVSFLNAGIPSGGVFSGASGIKTDEEAQVFGGTAGVPYDECYHEACDDIANVNVQALEEMSHAAAHAVLWFAMQPTTNDSNNNAPAAPSVPTNQDQENPVSPPSQPEDSSMAARHCTITSVILLTILPLVVHVRT